MKAQRHLRELEAQRRPWPENLVALERVASTHTLGRRIVREYQREFESPQPILVVAYEQTAGHGRGERPWASPPGQGVYATLVVPEIDRERLRHLPMVTAVALAEGVNEYLEGACRLKWPNDLMVRGAKLGGVLLHALHDEDGGVTALVSFGVNHRASPVPESTYLRREAADPPSLAALTWTLVAHLKQAFQAGSDEAAAARFAELAVHRPGDALVCRLGPEVVEGTFRGFDPSGYLRLETSGEERLLASGEIVSSEGPP